MSYQRASCQVCRSVLRPDEQSRFACRSCEKGVQGELEELAGPRGLFARLVWAGPDLLTPRQRASNGDKVKTSKTEAPSPVRMEALDLLGAGGVVGTLQRWVGHWYSDLGFTVPVWRGPQHFVTVVSPAGDTVSRPGQLDQAVSALINCLPWAVENRLDFSDFAKTVRRFVRSSASVLDPTSEPSPQVPIGRCPTVNEDTESACGQRLLANPFAFSIRCPQCGTTWARSEWADLGTRIAS